ncbi:MAG: hypothetical protein EBY18_22920, partial [Alphaproteobacteria bacterium]|nr:hypothetical protein [Alphaproteobacteria bacterium]
GLDVIRARGLVSSQAWGSPHLIPITQGEPVDGILDLIFQGVVSAAPAPLGPFMPFEALLPVDTGHPYKGVRVRSGTNAITLNRRASELCLRPQPADAGSVGGQPHRRRRLGLSGERDT